MTSEPVLGILGGMGPDATVNFMNEVISRTPADTDQEHIEMFVHNDPKIPDRNKAILEDAESPLPRLRRDLQKLESAGADVVAIPCNTVHFYYNEMVDSIDIDILNIIQETKEAIQSNEIQRVGLLSTSTIIEIELYRTEFKDTDIEILHPEETDKLMDAIYSLKAGEREKSQGLIDEVISSYRERDIDALIMGCSDLSVLSVGGDLSIFDPINILAESSIQRIKSYR